MLKCRFALAVAVFLGVALLSPSPSQAASRSWIGPASPAVASLFAKVERWWSSLLSDGMPAKAERSRQIKNGPGMDPNGEPLCTECVTGGIPSLSLPTDPSGSN